MWGRAGMVGNVDWAMVGVIVASLSVIATLVAWLSARSSNRLQRRSLSAKESEQRFRGERRLVNELRSKLTDRARAYYAGEPIARDPLLASPAWIPSEPLPLDDLQLELREETLGGERLQRLRKTARPLIPGTAASRTISGAIEQIEQPPTLDNRLCYRLAAVEGEAGQLRLVCGTLRYFDFLDVGEALALELARANTKRRARTPLRDCAGGALDVGARPSLLTVNALTVWEHEQRGQWQFLMHRRKSSKVPVAGDSLHVLPAGGFQPAADDPARLVKDFSIWRTLQREFDEELLGASEATGRVGTPKSSEAEPYRTLDELRDDGLCVPWVLGLGLDPLTLAAEVGVVVVFHGPSFSTVFANMVAENEEGSILGFADREGRMEGHPFEPGVVNAFLASQDLHPAARFVLGRAQEHRRQLLARPQAQGV